MKKSKRRIKRKSSPNKLMIISLVFILTGMVLGGISAVYFGNSFLISEYLSGFINTPKNEIFKAGILKYGKYVVGIWFLAFLPIGFVFAFLIMSFKAFSFGYTVVMLVNSFGGKGVLYSFSLCIIQNLLFFPVLIFTTCYCTKIAIKKDTAAMPEYLLVLGLGMVAVVIIAAVEAYIIPYFI